MSVLDKKSKTLVYNEIEWVERKVAIEEIERLNKKIEILEENNKLSLQQKSQMYEDLDIAYERIDKAIEYLELFNDNCSLIDHSIIKGALNILKGIDKE